MDRRKFVLQAGAAVAAAACCPKAVAQASGSASVEFTLREDPHAPRIPLTYTGLSYELAQLTDPAFFSAANHDLVAFFRLLSSHGVLRVGGNTSEFCWFQAYAATAAPVLHVPTGNLDANWMPHRLFPIKPAAIDALAGFLQATGWRLIYGLNFGNSTPQRAAVEAAYVADKVGERLDFFQIGNEPDFYHDANNGTRSPNWGFADYVKEWTGFAEAIAARVPEARFGGPDAGASSSSVTRFGEELPAAIALRVVALTGHYYAEGPPNDPRVTTRRLLAGNPNIPEEMKRIETAARAHGRVYRMTEGNSCYRGGKPGMSNAFAAALWAGDYMLQLASLGCAGVNLHGGSSALLSAGLGDHAPGLDVVKTPQPMRAGFYTPIFSEPEQPEKAMPIFYGMMLANQLTGGVVLPVEGTVAGVNCTAYAALDGKAIKMAIFNKDEAQAVKAVLHVPGTKQNATSWRLAAPALDSTEGVTLAGAAIEPHGRWRPRVVEQIEVKNGTVRVGVPAASACLIFLS